MKKCLISATILGLIYQPSVVAADDPEIGSESGITKSTIVVSATRSAQSDITTPASITVITSEEIKRSGAKNVVDVLQARGGIQITDLFGDGSRAKISMRGFSGGNAASNTLILIDGRRLNNVDLAAPDLNSIALKDVEQIEIIQGSAGTLFGDQAVGGVVNIITRQPTAFGGDLAFGLGSYNTQKVRGSVSNRFDNGLSFRLSGEKRKTDNYRDHNEQDYSNGFGRLDYNYKSGIVFAELQRVLEDLELPGYLTESEVGEDRRQANPWYPDDHNSSTMTYGRIGLRQELGVNWQFEAELTSRDRKTDGIAWSSNFNQNHEDQGLTPRFVGTLPIAQDEILLTVGADLYDYDYSFNPTSPFISTQASTQENRAYYAQAVIPLGGKVNGTLGARYATMDSNIKDSTAFPGGINLDDTVTVGEIGLSYKVTPSWRLFARGDRNFRFPKVDEQVFTEPGVTGLDTQTGHSYELGGEWENRLSKLKAVLYRLDLDNEIDYDSTADGPYGPGTGANVNLDPTRRTGLILEGSVQVLTDLLLSGQYTYTDPEIDGGSFDGNTIPFVAEHVLRIAADYHITPHWSLFAEAQYTGERYQDADYTNSLDKLPAQSVVNINVAYYNGPWSIAARVNNLTNELYSGYATYDAYYPAPERNFMLNAAVKF